jgi:hypothetical protein
MLRLCEVAAFENIKLNYIMKQKKEQQPKVDNQAAILQNRLLYDVPSSHAARRMMKAELRLKLQLMEAEYKRLGSEILLIKKQMDDLSTQMKQLMDNSQLIADALLEDEYNALVGHGI